mmetsp:Transcript_23255/g.64490  ORF Transcript_23255/g.64490 Transcript_23255/m.64490 type:complete len:790 (+) Transcript_23255:581-2950(+)
MGPFVLAETNFPSLSASSVPSFLSPGSTSKSNSATHRTTSSTSIHTTTTNNNNNKDQSARGSRESTRATSTTPTSTTTACTTTSSSSLEDFCDPEEQHDVEVIHSSPGRRSRNYYYPPQNDARTTTITSTRRRNNHDDDDNYNSKTMPLQLDRYGFIVNIDSKGHILETNGAESITVPSFADSERTRSREKKWKTTLQGWDKQSKQGKLSKQQESSKGSMNMKQGSSSLSLKNKQHQSQWLLQKKPIPRQVPIFGSNTVVLRRLRKGIPDSMRGRVWMALGGGIVIPGMYQEIVRITSDAMLENCRELQARNKRKKRQSLGDASGSYDVAYGESPSSSRTSGGEHTPERLESHSNSNSNSNSNRTSPTSMASEASTFTNTSPNKSKQSSVSPSVTATTTPSPMKPTRGDATRSSPPESSERGSNNNTISSSSNNNNNNNNSKYDNYATTRDFRSIQDIIERDIHRTFPRHNLFYEEERPIPQSDSSDGERALSHDAAGGGGGGSALSPASSNSSNNNNNNINPNLNGSGIFDPELAALILNLEMDLRMATTLSGADAGTTTTSVALQQYSICDGIDHCTIRATTQSGQAALRRVLRAYSYYDPEVGYCQGMNFIAGMFLTVMTEEEAFWMLVSVMSDKPCHMRGLFGEGMLQTHKVLYVAEKLIHHYLSRLARHFEKEHVHVTMYATQWLLTQYTSSFKFDLVFRVWDAFLGEGWKIIYRIMLALLQKYQSQLLKMSFEEILTFFRELPERVEGGQIMDMALKIPLRRKVIAKYEREWESEQQQKQQQQ